MAALLSESHPNLHLCLNPQCFANVVTSSNGAVKPPSLLLMELSVLLGPSTGAHPWKSTLFVNLVTFLLNVPAFSQRIPFDTMVIHFHDQNVHHISMLVDIC